MRRMPEPPWKRASGVEAVVAQWLSSGVVRPCLAGSKVLPEQPPKRAPIPASVPPELVAALGQKGIVELYAHQAEAVVGAQGGRHVVVATPTASGKSLCFHLPVLTALHAD